MILTTKFTSKSFKTLGLRALPYFVFDGRAYSRGYLTGLGALGDAAGNVVFLACSWLGYVKKAEEGKTED